MWDRAPGVVEGRIVHWYSGQRCHAGVLVRVGRKLDIILRFNDGLVSENSDGSIIKGVPEHHPPEVEKRDATIKDLFPDTQAENPNTVIGTKAVYGRPDPGSWHWPQDPHDGMGPFTEAEKIPWDER